MEAPSPKDVDMIQVRRTGEGDPLEFEVVISEGQREIRHHVTMARETCDRLTAGKHTPEDCLEAAFRFLLDREPNESILRRFDVTVSSLGGLLIVPAAWLCRASEGSSGNIRFKNEHDVVVVLVSLPLDFGVAKHIPLLKPTLYYVIS